MSDRSEDVCVDGGELLVRLMREAGVDVAFGIISVHNLPLVEAVARELRFITVRHEAAAVNAADAYSRVTGRPGVAITSTGTGAGNAAGAMIEALSAASGVVHVTGQIPVEYLGRGAGFIHETKDQGGMLEAVSARLVAVRSGASTAQEVRSAFLDAAIPGTGPVSVEWPIDLQYLPCAWEEPSARPDAEVLRPVPQDIDRAAALLARAERPLLWVGGGGVDAGVEVRELLSRIGAGLLTSNRGRGVIPETDPHCIGNYGSSVGGAALLAEADLLLSIGTHFRSNESRDYTLPMPEVHIQIDRDPAALGRSFPVTLALRGDARPVLADLLAALSESAAPSRDAWLARVRATRSAVRERQHEDIGTQARLCASLRELMPAGAPFVRDVTIPATSWGNRLFPIIDPRTNVFAVGGGIGQGLAMGVGAAAGRPDVPTVVIVGDGGAVVHLGELLTMAQEQLPITVIVFDDGGYGVLRNMQDAAGADRLAVDLHTPDFVALAEACGLVSEHVAGEQEFVPAVSRMLARRAPGLIHVDVRAVGDHVKPMVPPVKVPEGAIRGR